MKFFEPTEEFLDWLARHARGRVVFDVGCGEGHVLKALRARSVRAVGIDPLWDWTSRDPDLCSAVIPTAAEECGLLRQTEDSLVLFCRPCHDRFVERTLRVLPATSEALYVSLLRNLGLDFDLGEFEVTEVECPPCPEELVWSVRARQPNPNRRRRGDQARRVERSHR